MPSTLSPERGAKPVTSFVKNLSALSDWYSIYTSAIAFTVSAPGVGVGEAARAGALPVQDCLSFSSTRVSEGQAKVSLPGRGPCGCAPVCFPSCSEETVGRLVCPCRTWGSLLLGATW